MKTLTTSMILSVMFLTAGAFAQGSSHSFHRPAALTPVSNTENVTVVTKNAAWPPVGMISVEPCRLTRCLDI